MELIQMVVGVIPERLLEELPKEERGKVKFLSVARNFHEPYFNGVWFFPGCVSVPSEKRSELELLADEFSEQFGVQFGLKKHGTVFVYDLGDIRYQLLPLYGTLSSNDFKQKPMRYEYFYWDRREILSEGFAMSPVMAHCFEQFELL